MDIGWTIRAGVDPAATIRRLNGKLVAFHIKDINRNPAAEDGWANAGDGTFDWPVLLPEIETSGVKLLVLEHDNPPSYKAFASRSYAYVSKLIGRA
jgi:sugar phosphate isomerase/epimerase